MADQRGAQTSTWRGGGRGRRGRGRGGRGARPTPPPPDHFVSLRVPSEIAAPFFDAAHAALRGYAGGVLEPYLVGRDTAHVTLAVVRLNGSSRGSVPFGEEERKAAGSAAAAAAEVLVPAPASRSDASRAQRRDPLKVEAATRALVAAAESISAALLEEGRDEAEAEAKRNDDEAAKTTMTAAAAAATPSVASALLSNLCIEPELDTFSRGRVLWLKLDDGFGGRALAAAERAVARALEAEAAVLLGPESGGASGQSPLPPPPPPPPPFKPFTPHITVAKVPWSPQADRRSAQRWGAASSSSPSSSRASAAAPRPPSWIPEEAHAGALAGLPRSVLFGASELELCRIGSSAEGQYYEVVATAKISVAAKEEEEQEEGGGS